MDKFDIWFNKNEEKLVNKFLEDNPELYIHHRDYPNIPSMMAFQNFAEEEYKKKFRKKEKVVKRRKDGVVQRYNVTDKTKCRMCGKKLAPEFEEIYCVGCDDGLLDAKEVR